MPNRKTGYTVKTTDAALADDYVSAMLQQTKRGMAKANEAATDADRRAALFEQDNLENRIDDEEFLRFLLRIIRAAEARACSNPAILAALKEAADRLSEAVNVAAAFNALLHSENPMIAASANECARVLGITPASMSGRVAHGLEAMSERVAAAGNTRHAEAARERAIVERMRSTSTVVLADFRARKEAALKRQAKTVAPRIARRAV